MTLVFFEFQSVSARGVIGNHKLGHTYHHQTIETQLKKGEGKRLAFSETLDLFFKYLYGSLPFWSILRQAESLRFSASGRIFYDRRMLHVCQIMTRDLDVAPSEAAEVGIQELRSLMDEKPARKRPVSHSAVLRGGLAVLENFALKCKFSMC